MGIPQAAMMKQMAQRPADARIGRELLVHVKESKSHDVSFPT